MVPQPIRDEPAKDTLVLEACLQCPAYKLNVCRLALGAFGRSDTVEPSHEVDQATWTVKARRVAHRAGDLRNSVPFVCDGWAARYKTLPEGERQILSFTLPGEPVRALLFFEPLTDFYVEAVTNLHYRVFDREHLEHVLLQHAAPREIVFQSLLEEQSRSDQLLIDLGRRSAEERIARLIMSLVQRLKARRLVPSEAQEIEFPLRHHHIADATGLTPVHVSKILADLRRQNLLSLEGRVLSILDPVGLRRFAGPT